MSAVSIFGALWASAGTDTLLNDEFLPDPKKSKREKEERKALQALYRRKQ